MFLDLNNEEFIKTQQKLNPILNKEKSETVKKSGNIDIEPIKIKEDQKDDSTLSSYESYISLQIKKLKEGLESLKEERESIKNDIENTFSKREENVKKSQKSAISLSNEQRSDELRIEIKNLPEEFYQETVIFERFLINLAEKDHKDFNATIDCKKIEIMIFFIEDEKKNENLIKNLLKALPKEAHLFIFEIEKYMVLDFNIEDVDRRLLNGILKDFY